MTPPNQTILRAGALMDLLTQEGQGLGVREIARRMQLTRSTTHRLLVSLELIGLVEQVPVTGKYHAGYKAAYWAARSSQQSALRDTAMPHMISLRDATQETVGLSVRVQSARIYLAQVESLHDIRWSVSMGRLLPLYAGAPGKILLASLPDKEIEALLRDVPRQQLTPRTPTRPRRIWAEVHKVRREGIAVGLGEIVDGSATIAAPVRDARREVVAALSVSGPAFRFTEARRLAAVPALRAAADELSRVLGHGGAPGRAETRAESRVSPLATKGARQPSRRRASAF